MLILNDLSVRIAGRLLIERANINLPDGAKTGFVGHNGTGKSTLFRVITGELSPESGEVILHKSVRTGQVMQEAPNNEQSPITLVLEADKERTALIREVKTAIDPARIAEIHSRLADIDAHSAEARAGRILSGLGFDGKAQIRPLSCFSGGWRMRVALAAILFAQPDLLLLDEPTNYLDLEGTIWLIEHIRNYPHTAIIISHDQDLLNSATTSILHLENKKLTFWRGNYDQFLRQKEGTIILQQKQAIKQETQRKHMEAFVARFRAKATKARQAQARLKTLEKMEPVSVWQAEHVQPFIFPQPAKAAASPIMVLSGVDIGYEQKKPVLHNLNLRIDHDDRIALLGSNGNGKSTFAKLVAQRLQPLAGDVTLSPHLKTAFFSQHQLDDLYPEETPVEHVRRLHPQETEAKVRARVAQMGLSATKMITKAKELSGGEKARLCLGLCTFDGPNLLILDEPTNHLDIDSRTALVHALNTFRGAVLLIAHDRHLIEATMERLWKVENGTVFPWDGDMESYRADILCVAQPVEHLSRMTGHNSKKSQRQAEASRRAETASLRKQIRQTEEHMEKLQKQLRQLDTELADPELYQKKCEQIATKTKEQASVSRQLEEIETAWLILNDELQQAMQKNS